MSITSLNNLSVPTAGTNSTSVMLMPKPKYRFRVLFVGFGINLSTVDLTSHVMDINRPTINFEEIEVPIYNSRVYLAGRQNWEPVTVNLRDDASGKITRLVGQQIQKQFDYMEHASARSGVDYKFQTIIEILDGGNAAIAADVLERWELYGCFIRNDNYNDLNYTSNEPANITLEIRFDNAIQKNGVGTPMQPHSTTSTTATGATSFKS